MNNLQSNLIYHVIKLHNLPHLKKFDAKAVEQLITQTTYYVTKAKDHLQRIERNWRLLMNYSVHIFCPLIK